MPGAAWAGSVAPSIHLKKNKINKITKIKDSENIREILVLVHSSVRRIEIPISRSVSEVHYLCPGSRSVTKKTRILNQPNKFALKNHFIYAVKLMQFSKICVFSNRIKRQKNTDRLDPVPHNDTGTGTEH